MKVRVRVGQELDKVKVRVRVGGSWKWLRQKSYSGCAADNKPPPCASKPLKGLAEKDTPIDRECTDLTYLLNRCDKMCFNV